MTPLPQLCYDIAYYILPNYAYEGLDRLRELTAQGNHVGPFLYFIVAKHNGIEPDPDVARTFLSHTGTLDDGSTHITLEYPTPPPVTLDFKQMVLAPYFSSIVETKDGEVKYYILGQSPMGGITLRTVTADGVNANLGPGTEPALDAFLARISQDNEEGFEIVAALVPPR